MGNVHFYEIADWLLGWLTYDISGDDLLTYYKERRRARAPAPKTPAPASSRPPRSARAGPRRPSRPTNHGNHRLEDLVP